MVLRPRCGFAAASEVGGAPRRVQQVARINRQASSLIEPRPNQVILVSAVVNRPIPLRDSSHLKWVGVSLHEEKIVSLQSGPDEFGFV